MTRPKVTFLPDGVTVEVEKGTTLFRAAAQAGIELKTTCGGDGTCGQCAVLIREGEALIGEGNLSRRHRQLGYRLACRTRITGDLVVEIPKESRLAEHQIVLEKIQKREILAEKEIDVFHRYPFQPLVRQVPVVVEEPSLTENTSDLSRLMVKLRRETGAEHLSIGLEALKELPETMRKKGFRVTAMVADLPGRTEVTAVRPGHREVPAYGLAVDIGTTTVVVHLVDLETGNTIDRRGTHNRQARYGDDVINRIIHAVEAENGRRELQQAVIRTINELVDQVLARNELTPDQIQVAVVAGNTTMTHLFLGIDPRYIRLEPYIPAASSFPPVRAAELGLHIYPGALVFSFPAVASYVGGDIVAGVLATDISNSEALCLFIDIGTNGEIVLGNREWMVACACSAGPCFEGGGITFGMRAMPGAIERVEIHPNTYHVSVKTIGGGKPLGICGSGLVDALAKLREAGVIDRAGKFQPVETPRRRDGPDGPEFVLVWGEESEEGKDIVITEADIKNLLRAKGAIYAGIRSLLQMVALPVEAIEKVYIAGGFGNYLNVRDAIEIGMLPDIPHEKYEFVGNTSVKGARLALLSRAAWREAGVLAGKMTYLELSAGNYFMDEFVSAMFLPHTDLTLFPSVAGGGGRR